MPIIQLVLDAGMVTYAGAKLSAAHGHLSEICHNAPELAPENAALDSRQVAAHTSRGRQRAPVPVS